MDSKSLVPFCLSALLYSGGAFAFTAAQPSPSVSPTQSPEPQVLPAQLSQEQKDYQAARLLYIQGNYEAALKSLDQFKSTYTESRLMAQAENLMGLCLLLTKQPLQAIPHFKAAVRTPFDKGGANPFILYNLAKAQLEAGLIDESQATVSQIDPTAYDRENRSKYDYLKSTLFLKKSRPTEAARTALASGRGMDEGQLKEFRGVFSALLDQALNETGELPILNTLYLEFEDSPFVDVILFHLVKKEQSQGATASAEAHLQTLSTRFPHSEFLARASALGRTKGRSGESEYETDPYAIGVLLPLKGKFSRFGSRTLQGIELALDIFDASRPDSKVTLVIEDCGDEPDQAVKALNRLVTQHHVVAVIGPLLAKGIEGITRRAQELHVPLLSLAKQSDIPGDSIISAGLTYQLQAYELARIAIQKMNLHKFAILAPRDKVGEAFAQSFWDAVESFGGEITGSETYNPGETDFRQAVDKLSGLYYTEARQHELNELAKLREENQIRKRTRKTEQYYTLRPIVDYDAVFVPDEPKVAGQALPTFAYRDVDNVRFLGPSAWNSPEFVTRAQNSAENAIFVEAFFPASDEPAVQQFIENYKNTFAEDPGVLEAAAYDATKLLARALASSDRTRDGVLNKLKEVKDYPGVTGKISYRDGQFYRDLKTLTIRQGKIELAK